MNYYIENNYQNSETVSLNKILVCKSDLCYYYSE